MEAYSNLQNILGVITEAAMILHRRVITKFLITSLNLYTLGGTSPSFPLDNAAVKVYLSLYKIAIKRIACCFNNWHYENVSELHYRTYFQKS